MAPEWPRHESPPPPLENTLVGFFYINTNFLLPHRMTKPFCWPLSNLPFKPSLCIMGHASRDTESSLMGRGEGKGREGQGGSHCPTTETLRVFSVLQSDSGPSAAQPGPAPRPGFQPYALRLADRRVWRPVAPGADIHGNKRE
ncbi:hypothetical protein HJG60_009420 [Phyllostomus discolor]|uniref:Uncharacterized protein n=1 Tax=Phyllostomus discolor TaxID=89673 RepID=A0A834DCH5_9CHIR|nr:hypothetical protein HJG60_009420 [Phyllostomus discolor]